VSSKFILFAGSIPAGYSQISHINSGNTDIYFFFPNHTSKRFDWQLILIIIRYFVLLKIAFDQELYSYEQRIPPKARSEGISIPFRITSHKLLNVSIITI